jgi:hypothetical protein
MQSTPSTNPTQPSTKRPASRGARLKALIRKNLVVSPDFPRLYAEVLESEGYNFNEAKDLAIQLQKKLGVHKPERGVQTCSHIMVTGLPCQSPALRDKQFCYFHQRMLQGVALPRTQFHPIALLENEEAIQVSIMQVINGLMNGAIDLRRGELILRALNTAVRNSRRVRFNADPEQMVTEVPHYEQEAEARVQAREEVRTEIARIRTEAAKQTAEKAAAGNPRPAAESAGRIGQPEQSSAPQAAAPRKPPEQPANVTKPKPPLGVREVETASDRKTAARAGAG